ncbi:MAG: hypothetical protein RLO50_08200, partial [Azospirillaceae bacterium]
VDGLAALPAEADGGALLATLGAIAHHRARCTAPRWHAGGMTRRANRRRWDRYQPFLTDLVRRGLAANFARSLELRARAARLPADWAGCEVTERRLARQLPEGAQVAITASPPRPGGQAALAEATTLALAAIGQALRGHQPCLVELVRDPARPLAASELAIVYAMAGVDPGAARLMCCRADTPETGRLLSVAYADGRVEVREQPRTEDTPSIKGLLAWQLPDARPPLYGLRRVTWWLLPWRSLWLLGRALRLTGADEITGL